MKARSPHMSDESERGSDKLDVSRAPALLLVSIALTAVFSYTAPRSAALLFICIVASTHIGLRSDDVESALREDVAKARKSSTATPETPSVPPSAKETPPVAARSVGPMTGQDLKRREDEFVQGRMQRFRQPIHPDPRAMHRQLDAAYLALEKSVKRDPWSVLADEDEEMTKHSSPRGCSRRLPSAPPRPPSAMDVALS